MKKTAVLMAATLILSVSIYAMGKDSEENKKEVKKEKPIFMEMKDGEREFQNKFTKLSEEQKSEVEKILKKYSLEKKKIMIEIREKEIVVDKLLIEEKIDWTKIEKAVTDVSISHAKIIVIQMKEQKEITGITGEEFYGRMNGKENGGREPIFERKER